RRRSRPRRAPPAARPQPSTMELPSWRPPVPAPSHRRSAGGTRGDTGDATGALSRDRHDTVASDHKCATVAYTPVPRDGSLRRGVEGEVADLDAPHSVLLELHGVAVDARADDLRRPVRVGDDDQGQVRGHVCGTAVHALDDGVGHDVATDVVLAGERAF